MNIDNTAVSIARSKIFISLIMSAGELLRGSLENRLQISSGTFSREYKGWLEQYPKIHYNKKTRMFTYVP